MSKLFLGGILGILFIGLTAVVGQDIPVSELVTYEVHSASCYNYERDEFLIVWEDYQNANPDIYGRIMKSDGSFLGPAFPICIDQADQIYPATDYNRYNMEYIVVWQDNRLGGNDIYGIRLNMDGGKINSTRSLADTSFIISDNSWCQYHPRVAHNYINNTYLVVWYDTRNYLTTGYDIYGQRLDWNSNLLAPYSPPATDVNYPLSRGLETLFQGESYDDVTPDVAFHGSEGTELNEWLVVFARGISYTLTRIWGVRVNGTNGKLLNTWGEEDGPPPLTKSNLALGGPPWFPEFPIGFDSLNIWGEIDFIQGSPHTFSNAKWLPEGMMKEGYDYSLPEFLVAWTDFRNNLPDIYGQRVAYYPDSIAVKMGWKTTPGDDSLFTAVLLDTLGHVASPFFGWIDWPNYPVTNNPEYQSWNDLTYNQNNGEYLVVWNDWRKVAWDGMQSPTPAADVYGQRLYLNPADSSLLWLDDSGNPTKNRALNIPIAAVLIPDEGNKSYPAPSHGIVNNEFMISYDYDAPADNVNIDIWGTFYAGSPPTGVKPIETDQKPDRFLVSHNYPNPFNPATTIAFELPLTTRTTVKIYDLLGHEVTTLLDRTISAGKYQVSWDGRDAGGRQSSSGVYFYRIEAGPFQSSSKMILMR
ncbi:T9SS type A sorting domain-containing protein [bacterium]|nr:T9SS type A sorting domain-containing protein [bacterium]